MRGVVVFGVLLGAVEARYRRWRETTLGQRAWNWMLAVALTQAVLETPRIGVKSLVERCRDALKVTINNSWTGFIARDLVDAAPAKLRPRIQLRELGQGRGAVRRCETRPVNDE